MARLVFFGRLRELAGGAEKSLTLPGDVDTLARLIAWLKTQDPMLGAAVDAKSVRCCINREVCGPEAPVKTGDEIAFLPPLSGG